MKYYRLKDFVSDIEIWRRAKNTTVVNFRIGDDRNTLIIHPDLMSEIMEMLTDMTEPVAIGEWSDNGQFTFIHLDKSLHYLDQIIDENFNVSKPVIEIARTE